MPALTLLDSDIGRFTGPSGGTTLVALSAAQDRILATYVYDGQDDIYADIYDISSGTLNRLTSLNLLTEYGEVSNCTYIKSAPAFGFDAFAVSYRRTTDGSSRVLLYANDDWSVPLTTVLRMYLDFTTELGALSIVADPTGTYLYIVSTGDGMLYVYTIAQPMVLVGSCALSNSARFTWARVSGGYLIVSQYNWSLGEVELNVYDISDPANPAFLERVSASGESGSSGPYFVKQSSADYTTPIEVGTFLKDELVFPFNTYIAQWGSLAVIPANGNGSICYDVSDETSPQLIEEIAPPSGALGTYFVVNDRNYFALRHNNDVLLYEADSSYAPSGTEYDHLIFTSRHIYEAGPSPTPAGGGANMGLRLIESKRTMGFALESEANKYTNNQTLTSADYCHQVRDVKWSTSVEMYMRKLARGEYGRDASIAGRYDGSCSFSVDLHEHATANQAPMYWTMLRACGCRQTMYGSTGVNVIPHSDENRNPATIELVDMQEGASPKQLVVKLYGCAGNVKFTLDGAGKPLRADFEFKGAIGSISTRAYASRITPTSFDTQIPAALHAATVTLFGTWVFIDRFTLDAGNVLERWTDPSKPGATDGFHIVDAAPTLEMDPDMQVTDDLDLWTSHKDNTTGALSVTLGRRLYLSAPAAQLAQSYMPESREGKVTHSLRLELKRSSGNDAWKLLQGAEA